MIEQRINDHPTHSTTQMPEVQLGDQSIANLETRTVEQTGRIQTVGANWSNTQTSGRFVQIMRFRDRKHQLAVQVAERTDPNAQALIKEFCELINFPYQQQQGYFAVGFYNSVLPVAAELPPIRVNALHPGIVADSPFWAPKTEALEATRAKTPTGRLVEMHDVTDAAVFLLENPSMHGSEVRIDGGWSLT
jgi:hypothetical protein